MSDASDLEALLWSIVQELRGLLGMRAASELALALLFLKHASDVEHNRTESAGPRLVVPPSASFDMILADADKPDNARRLETALSALERANMPLLERLSSDLKLNSQAVRNSVGLDTALSCAIKLIAAAAPLSPPEENQYQATNGVLDDFLKVHFAKDPIRAGEIYTPRAIARMIAEVTMPRPGESVYDPACGTGSMLLAAAEYLKSHSGNGEDRLKIFGQEKEAIPARLAQMNLFVHGVEANRVVHGDTLHNPLLQKNGALRQFDVVVANPPFSLSDWGWGVLKDDHFGRFKYGLPPKGRGDYAFILHMIESMQPRTGRMAVIVPHGVLFRGGSEGEIRKNLIESNLLDAVVGLPPKLFYNTAIPTAMMVFRRGRETDSVMFVDASRDYEVGRKLNSLREEDVVRIVKTYRERVTTAGYSRLVGLEEIARKDFNLNIALYVMQAEAAIEAGDMAALGNREKALVLELAEIQREIELRLQEIGLRG